MSDLSIIADEFEASISEPSPIADKYESTVGFITDESDDELEIFDPAIHRSDSNGNPLRNKDGSYSKKRGRRSTSKSMDNSKELACEAAAVSTVDVIVATCIAIGGEEFIPILDEKNGVNETQRMVQAWRSYYAATGIKELPPWVGVAIATGSYAAKRVVMPKTKSRLQKLKDIIKFRYYEWRKNRGS